MAHVFLSYAKEDVARARLLSEALQVAGFSVWWDRHIPPGKTWDEVIRRSLDGAGSVVVLWSKHSIASRWVLEEAEYAANRKPLVPVISVLIENVEPPLGFKRFQAADLSGWKGDSSDTEFQSVCSELVAASVTRGPSRTKPFFWRWRLGWLYTVIAIATAFLAWIIFLRAGFFVSPLPARSAQAEAPPTKKVESPSDPDNHIGDRSNAKVAKAGGPLGGKAKGSTVRNQPETVPLAHSDPRDGTREGSSATVANTVRTLTDKNKDSGVPSRVENMPMKGSVQFRSDPGDYVGGGKSWTIGNADGTFVGTINGSNLSIRFHGDDLWDFTFAAPEGQHLMPETYPNASRAPFNSPVKPGLSVSGAGRGCNTLAGEFKIRQLGYSGSRLRRLLADFEQHCEGQAPALSGIIDLTAVDETSK